MCRIDKTGHLVLCDFSLSSPISSREYEISHVTTSDDGENSLSVSLGAKKSCFIPPKLKLSPSTSSHLGRAGCRSLVGTPDYVSPEMLMAAENNMSYGKETDFWSLGAVMYECLVGTPPFYVDDHDPMSTCIRIMDFRKSLVFPESMSSSAQDLIRHLITDSFSRFDFDGIKSHPFFTGVDWDSIRDSKPPIVTKFDNDIDTQNFEKFEGVVVTAPPDVVPLSNLSNVFHAPFVGFEFKKMKKKKESPLKFLYLHDEHGP